MLERRIRAQIAKCKVHNNMNPTATRFVAPAALLVAASLRRVPGQGAGARAGRAGSPAPPAQAAVKKPHPFRGKVEKVDPAAKALTVAGEDVQGWMGAMTMVYEVDKPEALAGIAVGDQITATVYEGDFRTLHDIAVSAKKTPK